MAILIKGDNRGIAVDGDLTIEHLDIEWGQGVRSALGVHGDMRVQEVEATQVPDDALLTYILDDEDRRKVTQALAQCQNTGSVAILAKEIYTEEILAYDVVRSIGFCRAIIPLLHFETTENALKQAIIKQVK